LKEQPATLTVICRVPDAGLSAPWCRGPLDRRYADRTNDRRLQRRFDSFDTLYV
jgi:hypothetical protein